MSLFSIGADAETRRQLAAISAQVAALQETINKMAKTLQEALQDLRSEVAQDKTVIQSAVTLITGLGKTASDLKDQVAKLLAAGDPDGAIAAVEEFSTELSNNRQQLADAVATNTAAGDSTAQPA